LGEPLLNEEKEIFAEFLKAQGLRDTTQRGRILDVFLRTEKHVSVEDLYRIINRSKSRVGYATVHRTMKLMAECGLAREVVFDDGVARFEHSYRHKHHHHLICTRCRKVIEFSSDAMEKAEKAILDRYGFEMESHHYKIYGLCRECAGRVDH
jgi:Fur family ferric uptake transcriptional regulator